MTKGRLLREDGDRDPDWAHPGEAMDAAEFVRPSEAGVLADKHTAAEIFRLMLASCMPSPGYAKRMGKKKQWEACHRRMVATAYHSSPELFVGMTGKEVAAMVGLSWWGFRKLVRAVRDDVDGPGRSLTRKPRTA
jgi:hypothetical protein